MAGLLEQAAAPQEPGADENQATPEEQQHYEAFMRVALNKIYEEQVFDSILKIVETNGVEKGLAEITAAVVDAAQKESGEVSDDILFAAAEEIIEELVDALEKTGKIKDVTEQQMQEALGLAVRAWMQSHPERVDPQAEEEIRQVVGAAAQGAQQATQQQGVR